MRRIELTASSLDEAKVLAYEKGITVLNDITVNWKKQGSPIVDKLINRVVAEFFQKKKMFDFEGAGVIIEISKPTKDARKKPWKFIDKYDKYKKPPLKRIIEIRTKSDHKVVGIAERKPEAIKLAKELVMEYREDLYAIICWSKQTFDLKYLPSDRMTMGQYLVFGVDAGDVLRNQIRIRDTEKDFI